MWFFEIVFVDLIVIVYIFGVCIDLYLVVGNLLNVVILRFRVGEIVFGFGKVWIVF